MFKISSDCHIKMCQTATQRVILKSLVPFFREIYGLFVGIKIKHLRLVKHRKRLTNQRLCSKPRFGSSRYIVATSIVATTAEL